MKKHDKNGVIFCIAFGIFVCGFIYGATDWDKLSVNSLVLLFAIICFVAAGFLSLFISDHRK